LKNLPVGLLYDLYQPELPWPLDLGDGPLFDIHDTYINSVKEVRCWSQPADYLVGISR
jgi:autophagy-related protein 5